MKLSNSYFDALPQMTAEERKTVNYPQWVGWKVDQAAVAMMRELGRQAAADAKSKRAYRLSTEGVKADMIAIGRGLK